MKIEKLLEQTSNNIINSILLYLNKLEYSNNIKIFGSIAAGSKTPGDVDMFIDFSDFEYNDIKNKILPLLKLAKQYYGYFDPFVLIKQQNGIIDDYKKILIGRNDDATKWIRMKNAKELVSAGKNGISLNVLKIEVISNEN